MVRVAMDLTEMTASKDAKSDQQQQGRRDERKAKQRAKRRESRKSLSFTARIFDACVRGVNHICCGSAARPVNVMRSAEAVLNGLLNRPALSDVKP